MKKILLGLIIAASFAACKGGANSSNPAGTDSVAIKIEKNKETALASTKALINKDIEGIYKDCAAGFVDYGSCEYPPVSNIDSIKAGMRGFLASYPDLKGDSLIVTADTNTVVIAGIWSGTFTNDFMGIKATGKKFKTPDVDIYSFNDKGQITSHRSVQQLATFYSQLGIVE